MELSIYRVFLLLKKHFADNAVLYVLSCFAVSILNAGYLVFITAANNGQAISQDDIYSTFLISVYLFGGAFTISLFSDFRNRGRQLWLTLPVSDTERCVFVIISSFFLFPLIYVPLFAGTLNIMEYLMPKMFVASFKPDLTKSGLKSDFYIKSLFLCQTMVALCACTFKRYTYIITPVVILLLVGVFKEINQAILTKVFDIPSAPANIEMVDVQYRPEKWAANSTAIFRFTEVLVDEDGKIMQGTTINKVSGAVGSTMFGFVHISLSTKESGIVPDSRYFDVWATGSKKKSWELGFGIAFFIGSALLWVVVWLKLKESQL